MPQIAAALYRIALSSWFGGMAVFSLVMTPAIFRTEARETASRVVGAMFPAYFRYCLATAAVALAARFAAGWGLAGVQPSFGTLLLAGALAVTCWQAFVLLPRMERAKARIPSFEPKDAHHPARREFGRLHAVSMTVNFFMMAVAALLIAAHDAFTR